MPYQKILLTGGAGFIGSHVADALLANGKEVICIDNFDPFYNAAIKEENISGARKNPSFQLLRLDLADTSPAELASLLEGAGIDAIIHLAGRAGVRPSIQYAESYYECNLIGTLHLLEFARLQHITQFIFASSSSVYGNNPALPWREDNPEHHPISPYAATKLAAEELGDVYTHLHGIRFIALRLFTVYGPRQRPDLAIHRFYDKISKGEPIQLYGDGSSSRDYTFVTDIVAGILAALEYQGGSEVINLGDHRTISLLTLVSTIEKAMNKKAIIEWLPMQAGDVNTTYADISKAGMLLGYKPGVLFEEGIARFVKWKEDQSRLLTHA
ncbi:NAD-dependent epimerase/dehydratase family protein [Flavihumibacter stibioxidans]|uniref:NAD-dependent epimerase/dehydratase domain-containing protein n=1 Tax=Flavihumibacter stibioxidans TaxID=1834163 RepID=A0ABR7M6K5_9BACT|nr:NAD-dependent epimerase/dehydratase family protein [Flavihumibacter stibioxidans]MBC6490592.1 hypothetical protein [Flavihumibacter stibioxidans]